MVTSAYLGSLGKPGGVTIAGPGIDLGRCFNDWVLDKTSGSGGFYPTGDVLLPGGTYYMNPLDMRSSKYCRAYNPNKPYGNHLRILEKDGPGTVHFDLRPESAASALGQTQAQAYNDQDPQTTWHRHGGAFCNQYGHDGSLRWIFDGAFSFDNGAVNFTNTQTVFATTVAGSDVLTAPPGTFHAWDLNRGVSVYASFDSNGAFYGWAFGTGGNQGFATIIQVLSDTQARISVPANFTLPKNTAPTVGPAWCHILNAGVSRVIFHGCQRNYSIDEYLRQFNIICGLHGFSAPAPFAIPDSSPYNDTVRFSEKFHRNYFPSGFRLEGTQQVSAIRCDIGPLGDDGMFQYGGDRNGMIGVYAHDVDAQGKTPSTWHHNDDHQITSGSNPFTIDSTMTGHSFEWDAEGGSISGTVIDRVFDGPSDGSGMDLGARGYSLDSSNKIGSGAPDGPRITGHYYKGFSHGMGRDVGSGLPQGTLEYGAHGWRYLIVDYDPAHDATSAASGFTANSASISNLSVEVPAGVLVDPVDHFMTSSMATFKASPSLPHNIFAAAYGVGEVLAILTDYGISLGAPTVLGSNIVSYINLAGDAVVVVPNGRYAAGTVSAAIHRAMVGTPAGGKLYLVAETQGGVIVDQSPPGTVVVGGLVTQGDLILTGTTAQVVFVGFKFVNGTMQIRCPSVYTWYCENTFPVATWHAEPNIGSGNPTGQYHYAPRTITLGFGNAVAGIYGADVHGTGTGIYSESGGTSDLSVAGTKIFDMGLGLTTFDLNNVIHPDCMAPFGYTRRLILSDSYLHGDNPVSTGFGWEDAGTHLDHTVTISDVWITACGNEGMLWAIRDDSKVTGTLTRVHIWGCGTSNAGTSDPGWQFIQEVDHSPYNGSTASFHYAIADFPYSQIAFTQSGCDILVPQTGSDPATAWRAAHPYDSWFSFFGLY